MYKWKSVNNMALNENKVELLRLILSVEIICLCTNGNDIKNVHSLGDLRLEAYKQLICGSETIVCNNDEKLYNKRYSLNESTFAFFNSNKTKLLLANVASLT